MVKIKSTTIIETIVAMLILTISFEIGVLSVSRTILSFQGVNKIKALFIAEKEFSSIYENNEFLEKEYENQDYIIKKTITDYMNYSNLKLVKVEVKTKNNILLIKKQRLMIIDEN